MTKDVVARIAKEFGTRTEFSRGDGGAYKAACREGWLDEVCEHMAVSSNQSWEKEEVISEAKRFSTRIDFLTKSNGAYQAAYVRGWLEDVCAHMQKSHRELLDKDCVFGIAKKFATRHEFKLGDNSAYNSARRNGWLEEACAHMQRGIYGFNPNKRGTLYQIKFLHPSGCNVWKVGITNDSVKSRLRKMGVPAWILLEITHEISYEFGVDALAEERRLHALGRSKGVCYDGEPFLVSGNTELFLEPLVI